MSCIDTLTGFEINDIILGTFLHFALSDEIIGMFMLVKFKGEKLHDFFAISE